MTNERTVPGLRSGRLSALTSLRFFAALYVVFHHAFVIPSFLTWIPPNGVVGRFLGLGYVAVSFFFLLSGYILGIVYLQRGGTVDLRSFYSARFARVYPLFFLTLVIDTPNLLAMKVADYGLSGGLVRTAIRFVANTFMLQAWYPPWRGIDNPNWSLSAETFFYLAFPFLGIALWKLRGMTFWLASGAMYLGGQLLVFWVAPRISAESATFLPILHLSTFAMGILLARWQTRRGEQPGRLGRIGSLGPSLVTILAVACFCAAVNWSPLIPRYALYDGLLAPVFIGVIWSFSHSDWLPARILSVPWLVVLGEASFGLYLIHFPVLHLFEHLGWDRRSSLFPVFLFVNVGLSVLSFYYFEVPMRRWVLKRERVVHVKETIEMASDAQ